MKKANLSGIAAALAACLATLAQAATPLILPLGDDASFAKSAGQDSPVRFNVEGLQGLAPGAELELTLPNGSRHDYVFEHSVSHGGGITSWVARSPLTGDNERAIITSGPGGTWGWMRTAHGDYRIYPSGKGYDLVAWREKKDFSPKFAGGDVREAPPDMPHVGPLKGIPTLIDTLPASGIVTKGLKVTPVPIVQSDVMFLYTKDLGQKLGVGLMPMLYNLVTSMNQAYVDSEVAVVLRLVNATMIDYANAEDPNPNGSGETLNAMAGFGTNAPFFQSLTWGPGSLRDTVGADFVALLRDGPTDTGGIGNLPKNPFVYPVSTVNSSTAYSVNNYCASGCESIVVHELGHNMGSHHDPATIAKDGNGPAVLGQGVFAFSYGFYSCAGALTCNPYTPGGCPSGYTDCAGNNANDFGTIMSYFSPKVMKFSNPGLSNCVPQGGSGASPRACGGSVPAPAPATTSNNALSINNVRGSISAYRNQTLTNLAGSVQFTNTGYSGPEGGNITFTVSRTGGSSGAISVPYNVTAGTATAGSDFTLASGTLSWNAGETANKTFNVAAATDALVEGAETVIAALGTPTGAAGVYKGFPESAVGLIVEAWPVGTTGALPTDPAGWTSPADANVSSAPWAISTDSAPPGDPGGRSLKSGAINFAGPDNCTSQFGGAITCPSVVQIARNFAAGTVAFAYRVSAFPGFGFFEFLVDGVVVHSATGPTTNSGADSGWQFFSTTITAGNHTLAWRHRPGFSFACGSAIAQGGSSPAYPTCVDRSWIDQLAMPPAQVAPPNPPRLANISTRMQVLTGADVMIGGFVIGAGANKTVVIRARGPSLVPAGITNPLQNPLLQLFSGPTQIASNDNFASAPNLVQLQATGFAPAEPLEAAILTTLAPGAYTAIVSGSGGGTGVGLVEVFEVDQPTTPLINIATRGRVLTGNDVMIAGLIIQGTGPQTVVVRARGPSLIPAGITDALANPSLQLFTGSTLIGANDDFGTATNLSALTATGFAPGNPLESAILTTLAPGAYTAIVSGVGNTTGVAIVEVFKVP